MLAAKLHIECNDMCRLVGVGERSLCEGEDMTLDHLTTYLQWVKSHEQRIDRRDAGVDAVNPACTYGRIQRRVECMYGAIGAREVGLIRLK